MAVYQGTRSRAIALPPATRFPRAGVDVPVVARRRRRATVRARRRPSIVGVVIAAIVIAFAGAFFSLSQDIRVSANAYEADRLAADGQRLEQNAQDLRNQLNRLGGAPAIRAQAIEAGLGPLPLPVIVTAR